MSRESRSKILESLQDELDAPVLAYVTGDRPNLDTTIARDQIPRFRRHLDAIGQQERIAVLMYTRGGDTNTAWPFVNFVRAYCKEMLALVPFFSHSAGTLICLGADEIQMTSLATLSPIDPSVANAFNPQDPANPKNRIPIAVEDVIAYFELARSQGVKRDEDTAAMFMRLADSVHPLALGNVHRSIEQTRQLASKLIRLHNSQIAEDELMELIKRLTTAFYTHSHLINRGEAADMGIPATGPSKKVEKLLMAYYDELIVDLELGSGFDPTNYLDPQAQNGKLVQLERAYIETASTADAFVTAGTVSMQPQLPTGPVPQGLDLSTLPLTATFEIASDQWETVE